MKTTFKFIGDGSWQCNNCKKIYSGYITYCRDGCKMENITDGKGN